MGKNMKEKQEILRKTTFRRNDYSLTQKRIFKKTEYVYGLAVKRKARSNILLAYTLFLFPIILFKQSKP